MKTIVTNPLVWAVGFLLLFGGWLVAETQRPMVFRQWVEAERLERHVSETARVKELRAKYATPNQESAVPPPPVDSELLSLSP